jgi:hypothetical protein
MIFVERRHTPVKKTVLSKRLVKSKAALLELSLNDVNDKAGFPKGSGYIYRLFGRDNVQLDTINRIARVLECPARDIIEEIEVRSPSLALAGVAGD